MLTQHSSNKQFRYIIATILIALALLTLQKAITIHWSFGAMSLSLIFSLVFIRFKSISVNSTEFKYTDKSVFPIWSEKRIIPLISIESIESFESRVDKPFTLIDVLFSNSFFRGNAHPNTIVLKLSNGDSFSFVDFGDKESFHRFIETLSLSLAKR